MAKRIFPCKDDNNYFKISTTVPHGPRRIIIILYVRSDLLLVLVFFLGFTKQKHCRTNVDGSLLICTRTKNIDPSIEIKIGNQLLLQYICHSIRLRAVYLDVERRSRAVTDVFKGTFVVSVLRLIISKCALALKYNIKNV